MTNAPIEAAPGVPDLRGGPIPADHYFSEEYFEREKEHIFRKTWLYACMEDEIPEPGTYIVKDLPFLDTSIIVSRGKDGVVRGFHNVCAHRQNKVVWYSGGTCPDRGFQCTFHGWAFEPDGSLRGAPDRVQFPEFDRADFGLTRVACEVWNSHVFFHLDPKPAESLREYLGEYADIVDDYPFHKLEFINGGRIKIRANWKIMIDAFSEGYHVPFTHALSVPDWSSAPTLHFSNAEIYQRHHYLSFPSNPDSLVSNSMLAYEPMDPAVEDERDELDQLMSRYALSSPHPDFAWEAIPERMNPTGGPWGFDLWGCFPNFGMLIGGRVLMHQFWPIIVNETLFEWRQYQPECHDVRDYLFSQYRNIISREGIREDVKNPEETQSVLPSRARDEMFLSAQEVAIQHYWWVRGQYLGDLDDAAH